MEQSKRESTRLRECYYKMTHKSGLDIYVFPKKLTSFYALFATKYGSVDNCFRVKGERDVTEVPNGIAHYLEHRMFTQKDGSDITERFSEYGADVNAYTAYGKTVYLFSTTEHFDESLGALVDFVTEPHFTKELVERERGIIVQEIKMGEDNPYDRCLGGMLRSMYEKNSVRVDIAGTEKSVSEITAEMLYACYHAFYCPNNMALVVCGDVTPEQVLAIVDEHLPSTFVPCETERFWTREDGGVFRKECEAVMPVSKPIFCIGIKDRFLFPDADKRKRRDVTMQILIDMLFSSSGVLYNELFESGMISPDLSYGYSIDENYALISICGEAEDPHAVLEKIKGYIEDRKRLGLSREEFEYGKRLIYAEHIKSFDSTDAIADNMIEFIFDGWDIFDFDKELESIKLEEVEALLGDVFAEDSYCLSIVRPEKGTEE